MLTSLDTRKVPAIGPPDAKIMIVGEAPGETEEREGLPFVGLSGKMLDTMLREAGTERAQCYITNVVDQRPPDNNFEVFYDEDGEPTKLLTANIERLRQEILAVKPNVIVCLGNEPLSAVAGKRGISKWRGSIIPGTLVPGTKVVGTYHPAAVGRMYEWRPVAVMDLVRAVEQSTYPELQLTQRTLRVGLPFEELRAELERLRGLGPDERISFDIETAARQVTCIAFSDRADGAVCVPFWWDGKSCWPEDEELRLWELVTQVLGNSAGKIVQNGGYDLLFLRDVMSIEVNNLYMDTMLAHHAVYPEFEKGLDFLCAMYTDQPYYKDGLHAKDPMAYWRYNALDACVTFEVAECLEKELREFRTDRFYFTYVHKLIHPLIEIGAHGIKIDLAKREAAIKEYMLKLIEAQVKLDATVGHPLNVHSPKQMMKFLYEELPNTRQTKSRKKRGSDEYKETQTSDAATIAKLAKESPHPAYDLILEIRERKKILSTYLEASVDSDGRMRTSYNIAGTRTGRLSSRETIYGTGLNIQNVPPGLARSLFVPESGATFIQGDLSQAEARVVAYLAEDERLIRVFAEGGDIHRKNASIIFNKSEEMVTDTERQLAKKIVHASNYGMGPRRFREVVREEVDVEISEAEARRLLSLYFSQFHGIPRWHMNVQAQIRKNRTLVTPYGRKRMFFGYVGDDLFKEAYAFIPQSTVSDHLNHSLLGLYERFGQEPGRGARVAAQIHDALIVECPDAKVGDTIDVMKYFMERPIIIAGRECMIPADFKVGKSWDGLTKYAQP